TARPWVRIVRDREGNVVDGAEVSLMERNPEVNGYARSIVIALDPAVRGIDVVGALQGKKVLEILPGLPADHTGVWQWPEADDAGVATPVAPEEPPIDAVVLAGLREAQEEDGADFLTELIDQFLQDAPSQLGVMREAIAKGDAQTLAREAHRLKGGCGVWGARLMAARCRDLEGQGRAGSVAGADAVLAELKREFSRVCKALEAEKRKGISS
ncbi:MAG: Hpt domain-containing protein, partial [Candidatus Methylomirabilales bacterium]